MWGKISDAWEPWVFTTASGRTGQPRAAALLGSDGSVCDSRLVSLEPGVVRLVMWWQEPVWPACRGRPHHEQTSASWPLVFAHTTSEGMFCGQQQRDRESAPETLGPLEAYHPPLGGCVLCSVRQTEHSWVGDSSPCSRSVWCSAQHQEVPVLMVVEKRESTVKTEIISDTNYLWESLTQNIEGILPCVSREALLMRAERSCCEACRWAMTRQQLGQADALLLKTENVLNLKTKMQGIKKITSKYSYQNVRKFLWLGCLLMQLIMRSGKKTDNNCRFQSLMNIKGVLKSWHEL